MEEFNQVMVDPLEMSQREGENDTKTTSFKGHTHLVEGEVSS